MSKRKNKPQHTPKTKQPRLPKAVQEAMGLLNRGRWLDAEKGLRSFLQTRPEHAEATHLLGISVHQGGRHLEAIPILERAVSLDTRAAVPYNTLGEVARITGALDKAVGAYRRAIERDRNYAQAHNNLGVALHAKGEFAAAVEAFQTALELGYAVGETANSLGVTYQAMGEIDQAIESFETAMRATPKHALAMHNLSTVYKDSGNLEKARGLAASTCDIAPNEVMAVANLADILFRMGRYQEAREPAAKALGLQPKNPLCLSILEHIERALGNIERSAELLETLADLNPKHPGIHNDLGMSLFALGEIDAASDHFLRAIELAEDFAIPYENYSRTRRLSHNDHAWQTRLRKAISNSKQDTADSAPFYFALGKALDDQGQFDEAFSNFQTANKLVRQTFDYQPNAQDEWVHDVIDVFNAEHISTLGSEPTEPSSMVFVCGMPRSGTSLTEQILASHPQVTGAGELSHVFRLTEDIATHYAQPYPLAAAHLTATMCAELRESYLAQLGNRTAGQLVVDKAPMNFLHLGLIAGVFPDAKIILCSREPRDVGLSIFFQHFAAQNYFAYDLYEIGRFQRQHDRLVEHWQNQFPDRILVTNYEELIADQRLGTERLLAFCDIPWHDACMEFYKTKRAVQTASAWQVRQPIANQSVERWKHYAKHLGPLLAGLNGGSSDT